ncbi:Nucleoside-diphosphate-sugar epimerase [Flavobacterium resistens]|uniref:NAD-dependent epimerase/dehydratase family protein n=1 Tax=Flavobacterium resistens TaxID=443612 RepID=A0A521ERS8_9FLAO|nr:NAD-dependent epimerase/dehydratase family protein [Flavobacterium resistens]MRX67929.1 NAD-dependent epimerase/dehydratase family protein [Flavobacterium resistens]SMO86634.1 Nucleoside-diphosphate-sugar epimerase [Flavobacterium resistens]
MNILLTGANGFLGKSISEGTHADNHIKTLSRTAGDYKISLEKEIPVFKESFDLVIHAAGKAHVVPKTELEKKQFYDVNVVGTLNLLKGLEKGASLPKQFVLISSVAVYGKDFGVNIDEEHPLMASDAYGLSKIEAEKAVLNWCEKNKIVCTILRLPLLVGKNPPGNLGAMIKAIDKGFYFNIDKGKARKSMILVDDVTSFIFIAASVGGIYNLTDNVHPSFDELSKALSTNGKRYLSLPLILAKVIGKIGDLLGNRAPVNTSKVKKITSNLTFDDSKAKQLFDWKPKPVLEYIKKVGVRDVKTFQ